MSFAMLPVWLFLGSLMIAPQLWWGPMLNWRVDFLIYPAWMFVLMMRGRFGEVFKFTVIDKFFGLMYLWIILSSITNGWTDISSAQVFFYTKYFVVYRFTCASIANATDLRRVGYVMLVLALFLAVEAIDHTHNPSGIGWAGQSYAWIDAESASKIGLDSRVRWVGIFDGPGVFCVVFTSALPFAFQYLAPPVKVPLRLIALFALVVPIALGAYYTGSRGGILATAACVGMFLISRYEISIKRLIMFGALGVAALGAAPAYLTESKDSHGSAQGRVDMWAKGIEMVSQNPVFGIGKGNYARYTGRLVAHNSGLEAMGETGFLGLFFWMGMLYVAFKGLIQRRRETTDVKERETVLAVMMSMAGYLVSSLFVSLETEIIYFILGMMAGAARLSSTPVAFTRRDFWILCGIVLGYFVLFKLYVMRYY